MKKPTPFGKYYLLERINVGGMAEVFRAKAFGVEGFERLVAVKRILPNIAEDKDFIRMFIEEAKLAVQLNHANIAQIYDLGVNDGAYYIALEHMHGRDVRAVFDRCRTTGEPMPVAQACFIVMKVCEGLDYAHNKRDQAGRELSLVHRDVSPQNVLVSFEGEVKVIDFGIAKAAGKGSKTQAGILKGKFGYMSPEQVRGIPIDRRSDVFSCGIVLYELLTGERLFVGESDFSTLEKVRNVEILPPSTYNRRIPDELERIVLKALAKDTEERYQNAIDLHDELQAFVYTAGEFYSRKDLAGWMKKTFGREIEEETAKLESYRQLKPPPSQEAPAPSRTATGNNRASSPASTPPPRRSTQGLPAVSGTKPPPPPPGGRVSQQLPAVAPPSTALAKRKEDSGDLAWDDDELETQIYDNADDDPRNKKPQLPLGAPLPTPSPMTSASPPPKPPTAPPPMAASNGSPDLSSLVSTAKSWDGARPTSPGHNGMNGTNGMAARVTGSHKATAPADDPMALIAPYPPSASVTMKAVTARESQPPPMRYSSAPEPLFDPMGTFGSGARHNRQSKGLLYIAIGGAAVAVLAVVVVIAMTNGTKKPAAIATSTGSAASAPVVGDQNTGFDLYVSPPVATWRLDGDLRTDRLPSRIRGISPGPHTVAIDAPAGFMGQNQPVTVEAGKAPKVEITLKPIDGIKGTFESTPAGADVSLIIDGKREPLGPSPAKAPLDPRKSYQVLFEKPGYVSVNRPIVFSGQMEEPVIVTLENAAGAGSDAHASTTTHPIPTVVDLAAGSDHKVTPAGSDHKVTPAGNDHKVTPTGNDHKVTQTGAITHPDSAKAGTDTAKTSGDAKLSGDAKVDSGKTGGDPKTGADTGKTGADTDLKPKGTGSLTLGSKPPCDIFIDGSSTGQHTPQREIKLAAGKHRITLVNNEFGIKETFVVEIKADQTEKQIKDYSDHIPR